MFASTLLDTIQLANVFALLSPPPHCFYSHTVVIVIANMGVMVETVTVC